MAETIWDRARRSEVKDVHTFHFNDAISKRFEAHKMGVNGMDVSAFRIYAVPESTDIGNSVPLDEVTETTRETESLLKVFRNMKDIVSSSKSMTDICEDIRAEPGLPRRVLKKLRIYPDEGLPARLRHCISLGESTDIEGHEVIDLETAGLPFLDACIDLVTIEEASNDYWLWDYTSDPKLVDGKLERLVSAATTTRISSVVVAVAVFKSDKTELIDDFADRLKREDEPRTGIDSVPLVNLIGQKLLKYNDHNDVLEELDDIYTNLLVGKMSDLLVKNKNTPIVPAKKVDEVLARNADAIDRMLTTNYSNKSRDFRKLWNDVRLTCKELYFKFEELIREVDFSVSGVGFSTIDPKLLKTNEERARAERLLCKMDPISWGIYCLTHEGMLPDEIKNATRVGLLLDGTFTIESHLIPPDAVFNRPQTSKTRIAPELIAAFKVVVKTQHYYEKGGDKFAFMSKKRALKAMASRGIPREELKSRLVRTRGAQVLVNLDRYQDDRFHTFIKRHDKFEVDSFEVIHDDRDVNAISSPDWIDNYDNSLRKIHSIIDDDIGDDDKIGGFDLLSKARMLLEFRGPRTLHHIFDRSARVMNTPTIRRFLLDYECAKAMSHTLSDFSSANLVHVSNMGMTGAIVINFVNNGVYSFKTTWYKTMVLTDNMDAKLESPGSRIAKTTEFNPDYETFCENHGGAKMEIIPGEVWCKGHAHKWRSINSNQLNWSIESGPKAIGKMASLYEMRNELYDMDPTFARKELSYSILPLFVNRQQFSIISNAQRFLHGSLSSSHAEHGAPIGKLKGLRIRTDIESVNFGNMITTYLIGRLMMLSSNRSNLLTADGLAFTVMPDLLKATSSAHLSVSCYSTYTYLNDDKSERLSSEAECVRNLFEQVDTLEEAKKSYPDFVRGMDESTARALVKHEGSMTEFVRTHRDAIRRFGSQVYDTPNNNVFVTDIFFQLCTLLDVRYQIGPMDSIFNVENIDINQYFTTKGSITVDDFDSTSKVKSCRRVSAMADLASRVLNTDVLEMKDDDLVKPFDSMSVLFAMARKKGRSRLDIVPNIQLSEKDAPGKDREISTLHITYAVACQFTEELAKGVSKIMPEDLITTRAKDKVIYKKLLSIQKHKSNKNQEERDSFHTSTDKKRFGPNSMTATWLLNPAALSPDKATLEFHNMIAQSSAFRKTRFPHHILSQSLEVKPKYMNKSVPRTSEPAQGRFSNGRIGEIMNKIYNHYQTTGTKYLNVPEGMPGQGIFGINCSVAHSAVMRYISKVAKVFDWNIDSVITSDDAMSVIDVPRSDREKVIACLPKFIASTLSMCGLIENMGKYIMSHHQAEMNSYYFFRGEPVVPVGKFAGALVQEKLTANYADDLLMCVSQGAEMLRKGACLFSACWIAAVNMALVIDGHRQWDPLYSHAIDLLHEDKKFERNLWSAPVELFGIPSLDLHASLLGSSASKLSTFINIVRSEKNIVNTELMSIDEFSRCDLVEHYVKSLVMSMVDIPKKDKLRAIGDSQIGDSDNPNKKILVKLDNDNYEYRSTFSKRYFPSETGVRGRMKSGTRDHRAAIELGNTFVDYTFTGFIPPRSLRSVLFRVHNSLSGLLIGGEQTLKAFQAINGLNHTHNYRYFDLEANSPMNPKDKSLMAAKIEVSALLLSEQGLSILFSHFVERSERRAKEFDKLVANNDWAILSSLKQFYISILKAQITLDGGVLETNVNTKKEYLKECGRLTDQKKRLLVLNRNIKGEVSPIHVQRVMMSRFLSPEHYDKLSYAERHEYGILGVECKGDMDFANALDTAELCVQRVMARMPRPVSVNCNMPTGSSSKGEMTEFLKRNTMEGMTLKFRNKEVREITDIHLDFGLATTTSIYSRDQMNRNLARWALGYNVVKDQLGPRDSETRVLKIQRQYEIAKIHDIMVSASKITISPFWIPEGLRRCSGPWLGSYRLRVKTTPHTIRYVDKGGATKEKEYFHVMVCSPVWVKRNNSEMIYGDRFKILDVRGDPSKSNGLCKLDKGTRFDTSLEPAYEAMYLEDSYTHYLIGPKFDEHVLSAFINSTHTIFAKNAARAQLSIMNNKHRGEYVDADPFIMIDDNLQVTGEPKMEGNLMYVTPKKGGLYPIMTVPLSKSHLAEEILAEGPVWYPPKPVSQHNVKFKKLKAIAKNNLRTFLNDPIVSWLEMNSVRRAGMRKVLSLPNMVRMISTLGAFRPKESEDIIEVGISDIDSLAGIMVDKLVKRRLPVRRNPLCILLYTTMMIFNLSNSLSSGHVIRDKPTNAPERDDAVADFRMSRLQDVSVHRKIVKPESVKGMSFDRDKCIRDAEAIRKASDRFAINGDDILLQPNKVKKTQTHSADKDDDDLIKRLMFECAPQVDEMTSGIGLDNIQSLQSERANNEDLDGKLLLKLGSIIDEEEDELNTSVDSSKDSKPDSLESNSTGITHHSKDKSLIETESLFEEYSNYSPERRELIHESARRELVYTWGYSTDDLEQMVIDDRIEKGMDPENAKKFVSLKDTLESQIDMLQSSICHPGSGQDVDLPDNDDDYFLDGYGTGNS